jgi:hydrogenase nickel incorporation protein HypA/HybF
MEYALKRLAEEGKSRVTKLYLTVGESSGYSADTIVMFFKELSEGTPCEGAEVVVNTTKSMLECPACGKVFPRVLMQYNCPSCQTEGRPSKAGTEVEITGIEVE